MSWLYDNYIYRLSSADPYHTIDLPKDLEWEDESIWSPVEQSLEYSLTGALLIQTGIKLHGRTITLVGKDDMGWITRPDFDKLMTMRNIPDLEMTFEFIKREFISDVYVYSAPLFQHTVNFNHAEGALNLESIKRWDNYEPDGWFKIRFIRLIEVEPV